MKIQVFEEINASIDTVFDVFADIPNAAERVTGIDAVEVWDLETGTEQRTPIGHLGDVNSVASTSDGHAALSALEDKTLKVRDVETGDCLATFETDSCVNCVTVSPDEKSFVAGDSLGRVHFLQLEEGAGP